MNETNALESAGAKNDNAPGQPSENPARISDRLRHRLRTIGAAIASLAAVGAVISGLTGYWSAWKLVKTELFHDEQPVQKEAVARPNVAPRLSLVVLPFANLNNDPEQDYFADGIATDLTTDLAQMPSAFVIGRGTAFAYKNKLVDPKHLGKDLGVRWAVQGALRRNGDQIRINVSLTDLATGSDVWSDRFDGERAALGTLQDQITARLARSLNVELVQAESRRSEGDRSRSPDAVDFTMRGWAKFYGPRTKTTTAQARDLFDAALHIDPDNLDATIGKAWCMAIDMINGWSASVSDDKRDAAELIDRALLRRPSNAMAHVVKGETLFYGNPEGALREYEAALEIDPNAPIAQFRKGVVLILTGRAREAFSPLQIALRLSPRDPFASAMHYNICHAHLHLREYDNTINACRQSLSLNKANWFPYVDLVSAYGNTGQLEQAQQALAELNAIRSGFTVQWFHDLAYAYSSNQQFRELDDILDGLRKAGVREQ